MDPSFIEYTPEVVKSLADYAYILQKENSKLKKRMTHPHVSKNNVVQPPSVQGVKNVPVATTMYVQETVHPFIQQQDTLDESLLANNDSIVDAVITKKIRRPNIVINNDEDLRAQLIISSRPEADKDIKVTDVKAQLRQPLTDLITVNFFRNPVHYYNFISKLTGFMENTIEKYLIEKQKQLAPQFPGIYALYSKNHLENKVIFAFKGGNLLRSVFLQYLKEQPGILSDMLSDIYNDNFKNSDLDFQIFIHPNLHPDRATADRIYQELYKDLMLLTYLCLNRFRSYYLQRIHNVFDFYQLNNASKLDLLKDAHKIIDDADVFKPTADINVKKQEIAQTYGEDAIKLVGAKIENLRFYDIHTHPEVHKEYTDNQNNANFITTESLYLNVYTTKIDAFPRTDFYMKSVNYGGFNHLVATHIKDVTAIAEDVRIQDKIYPNGPVESEFYTTINEGIKFGDVGHTVHFSLVRTKCNFIGYIKFEDGKHGLMHLPGELIDISISAYDDIKNDKMRAHQFSELFTRYTFKNRNSNYKIQDFKYCSYNLHSFINDLEVIIYGDYEFPWLDGKYAKRLNRIYILCTAEFFGKNLDNAQITNIIVQLKDILNNANGPNTVNLVDNLLAFMDAININDLGLYQLFVHHKTLLNKINAIGDLIVKNKMTDEFIKYCANSLIHIHTLELVQQKVQEYIANPAAGHVDLNRLQIVNQMGGVHKKYLKYKQKYNQLKKNIIN